MCQRCLNIKTNSSHYGVPGRAPAASDFFIYTDKIGANFPKIWHLHLHHCVRLPHHSLENSRTFHWNFQDQPHFPRFSRAWKFYKKKCRTFQAAWEPWLLDKKHRMRTLGSQFYCHMRQTRQLPRVMKYMWSLIDSKPQILSHYWKLSDMAYWAQQLHRSIRWHLQTNSNITATAKAGYTLLSEAIQILVNDIKITRTVAAVLDSVCHCEKVSEYRRKKYLYTV